MLIQDSDHTSRKVYRWLSEKINVLKRKIVEAPNLAENTFLPIISCIMDIGQHSIAPVGGMGVEFFILI